MSHSKVKYYAEIYNNRDDYKRDLTPLYGNICELLKNEPNSVLDYGCGQGNLTDLFYEDLGCIIAKYDPAIEEYSQLPKGRFELGVNTDVLEHVPEDEIDGLLSTMSSYVDNAYFNIHLAEAKEILSNGENAHCTIKPPQWWKDKIAKHFGTAYITPSPYLNSCSIITWKPTFSSVVKCYIQKYKLKLKSILKRF